MTALFNFTSLLLVILLLVCTCAYLHQLFPAILDRNKTGYVAILALRERETVTDFSRGCGLMSDTHQRQNHGYLLEVRADRGAAKSLHELVLRGYGDFHLCRHVKHPPPGSVLDITRRRTTTTATGKGVWDMERCYSVLEGPWRY